MALFTDGPACSIQDLIDEDSGLLEAAQITGINVTSKIRLAMDELQSEVENWLQRPRPAFGPPWTTAPGIAQVVVTRELARWAKMQSLSMVYRDAYFSQLIDRYQGKWDEYAKLTRFARDQFIASGVALVFDPMPKAALPVLGTVSVLSNPPAGTFYVSVTWVNQAGQEGASSDAASITVPAGNAVTVMVTGAPPRAVGFNVYIGTAPAGTAMANQNLLPPESSFTYIPGGVISGKPAGTGQSPDYTKALPRTLQRG